MWARQPTAILRALLRGGLGSSQQLISGFEQVLPLEAVRFCATPAAAPAATPQHPAGAAPLSTHAHRHHDAWYSVRDEEALPEPPHPGDEGGDDPGGDDPELLQAFVSHHPSRRFANTLSHLRAHFPEDLWHKIAALYPGRAERRPVCVDIAVGAEGRGGVELARRGFRVVGVEANPVLLARTFEFAQAHSASIELITARVEHALLGDASADLVTFFHGLHLVDTHAALREAWRLLKPGGRLVAAWNDRDLSSEFMRELEDVVERHVASYNRWQKQRGVEEWAGLLQAGDMFKLLEYSVLPNPVHMHSASSLIDVIDCMSFVRASLRGEARKRLNNDVRLLLERRFGRRAFALPLETKVYVLKKVHDSGGGGGDPEGHGAHRPGHAHDTVFS